MYIHTYTYDFWTYLRNCASVPKSPQQKATSLKRQMIQKSSQGKRATLLATRCRLALRVPFVTSIASGMQ